MVGWRLSGQGHGCVQELMGFSLDDCLQSMPSSEGRAQSDLGQAEEEYKSFLPPRDFRSTAHRNRKCQVPEEKAGRPGCLAPPVSQSMETLWTCVPK